MSTLMRGGRWVLSGLGLVVGAAALGQETVQTLDRVQVNSIDSVLEMNFADPLRETDFDPTGITGASLRACELTALNGIYCLDGRYVRNWPDRDTPTTIVDCQDPVLDLDNRRGDACTALTVDSSGAVWIAGKKKRSHSLFRVVKAAATGCLPHLTLATGYCAEEVAPHIGRIDDMTSIDGDLAGGFDPGKGVLALLAGSAAVHFKSDGGTPTVLAEGKKVWTLQGNEQLLGIALLQLGNEADEIRNVILATTSGGRVLAKEDAAATARAVFDVAAKPAASVQCDFNEASYRVRASSSSGAVYVTDRQYCEVLALLPVVDPQDNHIDLQQSLTLSTAAGSDHPPEALALAPGISIDLNDCEDSCSLVVDNNGTPLAFLSNVRLVDPQFSDMTLFQIRNIPDCRYIPGVCKKLLELPESADLVDAGVIRNLMGNDGPSANPAGQLLNLTPLLPAEIRELFQGGGAEGSLPDMYMSRQYRGQRKNDFLMDAFFGITEEGVAFQGVFNGEYEVEELGSGHGCEPDGTSLPALLAWDTVTTVSERYVGIEYLGFDEKLHVDTLINTDCGSSRTLQTRWSIVPYNTEVTPCTYNDHPNDVWKGDGSCPVDGDETPDDAVFAKLLLSLYDELGATLSQLACEPVDGDGSAPLSPSSCATLEGSWANGKDKLDKCWNATQQPKHSAGDQTCQAFLSQLTGFSKTLAGVPAHGADPANRKGELRARVEVLFHVYHERFVPSLSPGGFCEPGNTGC